MAGKRMQGDSYKRVTCAEVGCVVFNGVHKNAPGLTENQSPLKMATQLPPVNLEFANHKIKPSFLMVS